MYLDTKRSPILDVCVVGLWAARDKESGEIHGEEGAPRLVGDLLDVPGSWKSYFGLGDCCPVYPPFPPSLSSPSRNPSTFVLVLRTAGRGAGRPGRVRERRTNFTGHCGQSSNYLKERNLDGHSRSSWS